MKLLFMRHGNAEHRHPKGDFARALTENGAAALREQAPFLAAALLPSIVEGRLRVLCSPYKRAKQTAEIVVAACAACAKGSASSGAEIRMPEITEEALIGEGNYSRLFVKLDSLPPETVVLLVGHVPSLTLAVEALSERWIDFGKGSLVVLEGKTICDKPGVLRAPWDCLGEWPLSYWSELRNERF